MKKTIIILIFSLIFIFGTMTISHAYCVQNQTDAKIIVYQTSGNLPNFFIAYTLNPNEKSCCSWNNNKCNRSRKRGTFLEFQVVYLITKSSPVEPVIICKYFKVRADGTLVINGEKGNYKCNAYEK